MGGGGGGQYLRKSVPQSPGTENLSMSMVVHSASLTLRGYQRGEGLGFAVRSPATHAVKQARVSTCANRPRLPPADAGAAARWHAATWRPTCRHPCFVYRRVYAHTLFRVYPPPD